MHRIVALIPARSGSKRIENKNMAMVGGWPLLNWTVCLAQVCNIFEEIVVSSDSTAYLEHAQGLGATPHPRRGQGATDTAGDREVILDYLSARPSYKGLIAYLRPTTPFRSVSLVCEAVMAFQPLDVASGMRSIEEMPESALKAFFWPHKTKLVEVGRNLSDLPNQEVEKTYRGNGYIDICRSEVVRGGGLWGEEVLGFCTPRVIEIDTLEDLRYADWWAKMHNVREDVIFKKGVT